MFSTVNRMPPQLSYFRSSFMKRADEEYESKFPILACFSISLGRRPKWTINSLLLQLSSVLYCYLRGVAHAFVFCFLRNLPQANMDTTDDFRKRSDIFSLPKSLSAIL